MIKILDSDSDLDSDQDSDLYFYSGFWFRFWFLIRILDSDSEFWFGFWILMYILYSDSDSGSDSGPWSHVQPISAVSEGDAGSFLSHRKLWAHASTTNLFLPFCIQKLLKRTWSHLPPRFPGINRPRLGVFLILSATAQTFMLFVMLSANTLHF